MSSKLGDRLRGCCALMAGLRGSAAPSRPSRAIQSAARVSPQQKTSAAPSVTVLGVRSRRRAFSARKCAAAPTRTWAASSTWSSTGPASVRAAVIDFGGFLGVGSRKIAVDWNALSFTRRQTARPSSPRAHARSGEGRARIQGQASRSSCSARPARCIADPPQLSDAGEAACRRNRRVRATGPDESPAAARRAVRCRSSRRRRPHEPPHPVAAQPARARLVRVLRRRRADRLRPVHLGLSDHAEMDADRHRPRAVDRRPRRAARARCRAAPWSTGRARERLVAGVAHRRSSRISGARLCVLADLSRWCSRPRCCMRRQAACSGPCIVALSLGLVGHAAIGERLGRNARFASIGNGMAAAAMGAIGYFFSPHGGVLRHRRAADPDAVRAQPHPAARSRSRARAWQPAADGRADARPVPQPAAPARRCSSSPAASRCSISPTPRCCR